MLIPQSITGFMLKPSAYLSVWLFALFVLSCGYAGLALAQPACLKPLAFTTGSPDIAAAEISSTILDFDGDGLSDIVSSGRSGARTIFDFKTSSNDVSNVVSLPLGAAVPGDYDADGKWDSASVRKSGNALRWTVSLSSTGQERAVSFGSRASSVIYGCRFLEAGKYSLAVFSGQRVEAFDLDSDVKHIIVFSKFPNAVPIGCGDATGDGIDELILLTRGSSDDSGGISTVSCINDQVDYGQFTNGIDFFVFDAGQDEIPVVGRYRVKEGRTLVRVNALYDRIKYPHFYLPRGSVFSFGKFSAPGVGAGLGILWQVGRSNVVTRDLFSGADRRETVARLRSGFRLLPSQDIVANSDIP